MSLCNYYSVASRPGFSMRACLTDAAALFVLFPRLPHLAGGARN